MVTLTTKIDETTSCVDWSRGRWRHDAPHRQKSRWPHSNTHCKRAQDRFARAPDIDRSGPQRDNFVRWRGWSVRFDIEKLHVGRFAADRGWRQNASVCDALLQQSVSVLRSSPHCTGRGGEQGDPLMLLLFCLGQHAALAAVAERLDVGERLFASLDDLYVVSSPERSVDVHGTPQNTEPFTSTVVLSRLMFQKFFLCCCRG